MLNRKTAARYARSLDRLANNVQANWRKYGLTKQAAYDFCLQVDKVSDRLERFTGRRADVIHRDEDEDYLGYYDIGGVIQGGDPDEEWYMDLFDDDTQREFDYPMEGASKWELKSQPQSGFDVDASWYRKRAEEELEEELAVELEDEELEAEASWYRRRAEEELEDEELEDEELEVEASWYRRRAEEELEDEELEAEASWYRRRAEEELAVEQEDEELEAEASWYRRRAEEELEDEELEAEASWYRRRAEEELAVEQEDEELEAEAFFRSASRRRGPRRRARYASSRPRSRRRSFRGRRSSFGRRYR